MKANEMKNKKEKDWKFPIEVKDAQDLPNGGVKALIEIEIDGEKHSEHFGFSPEQLRHERWKEHVKFFATKIKMNKDLKKRERANGIMGRKTEV